MAPRGCRPERYPTRHGFDEYAGLLYSNDMHPVELFERDQISTADVYQAALFVALQRSPCSLKERAHHMRKRLLYLLSALVLAIAGTVTAGMLSPAVAVADGCYTWTGRSGRV